MTLGDASQVSARVDAATHQTGPDVAMLLAPGIESSALLSCSPSVAVAFVVPSKKWGAQRAPHSADSTKPSLRSGLPAGRPLNLPRVQAASADLDLGDLVVDDDAGDLKVRLLRPARLVVRVGNVVAVRDALVAHVAAVSLDLCHSINPLSR